MDTKNYLAAAKRDAILVDALYRALYAMSLTNGCSVMVEGASFTLNFDHEMVKLKESLTLLGVNPNEPLPAPVGGRKAT